MKDHEIAALVNQVRDIAIEYRDTQQLRERIARVLVPALQVTPAAVAPAVDAGALAPWQTGTPPTKAGDCDEYIVAVRRAHAPEKVFVFSANYANAYTDDDSMHDTDGNPFTANGWYSVGSDMSGEFSYVFEKILNEGDAVLGWQPLPKWSDARASNAAAGEPGWKYMPPQPTGEMWEAGRTADVHPGDSYTAVYCAMFDAAPTHPASEPKALTDVRIVECMDAADKAIKGKTFETPGARDIAWVRALLRESEQNNG